jgi:hypothetical protein
MCRVRSTTRITSKKPPTTAPTAIPMIAPVESPSQREVSIEIVALSVVLVPSKDNAGLSHDCAGVSPTTLALANVPLMVEALRNTNGPPIVFAVKITLGAISVTEPVTLKVEPMVTITTEDGVKTSDPTWICEPLMLNGPSTRVSPAEGLEVRASVGVRIVSSHAGDAVAHDWGPLIVHP